jgi:hypothetical protein
VNFKLKLVRRDKEGHLTLIKGEINQEEIKSINIYAPNINAPNFKKNTLMDIKTQIDPNIVVVGEFSTPLSPIDRSSRQKINKEHVELNDSIYIMYLTDG